MRRGGGRQLKLLDVIVYNKLGRAIHTDIIHGYLEYQNFLGLLNKQFPNWYSFYIRRLDANKSDT